MRNIYLSQMTSRNAIIIVLRVKYRVTLLKREKYKRVIRLKKKSKFFFIRMIRKTNDITYICVVFRRVIFFVAKLERCKIFAPIFSVAMTTWSCGTRGFLLSSFFSAFHPVRGRPDSGILWILRGGVMVDTLSVVAFEPTVYSIESDLYSCCSAVLFCRRSAWRK